jgi:hypothetical protein
MHLKAHVFEAGKTGVGFPLKITPIREKITPRCDSSHINFSSVTIEAGLGYVSGETSPHYAGRKKIYFHFA